MRYGSSWLLKEDCIIAYFIAMNGHKDKSKMQLEFITMLF